MGKKLAIKGHPTRGEEIVELLKMMGGVAAATKCFRESYCYYISEDTATKYISWDYIGPEEIDKYTIFTLEEFLEKYPFKVGDKVMDGYGESFTIESMSWSSEIGAMIYSFEDSKLILCTEDLLKWNKVPTNKETVDMKLGDNECERTHEDMIFDSIIWHLRNSVNNGKQNLSGGECEDYFREVVKKNNENKMKNVLAELFEHIKTTPKEDLEREFEEIKEWSNVGPTVEEFRAFCECVNKKPVYPKTYGECCKVLRISPEFLIKYSVDGGDTERDVPLIRKFIKLKRCRDVYWKIAGEQMGLGKPWNPDWTSGKPFYCISVSGNTIGKGKWYTDNKILAFPTEEMRDAFFENFKDLIEQCKELL